MELPVLVRLSSLSGSYALGFILLAVVAAICLFVLAAIDRGTPQSITPLGLGQSRPAITLS